VRQEASQLAALCGVVDPPRWHHQLCGGSLTGRFSLARFEGGVPVLAILDVPPPPATDRAMRAKGAWRNGTKRLLPCRSTEWPLESLRLALQPLTFGRPAKLPDPPLSRQDSPCWVWPASQSGQRGHGAAVAALGRNTPKIWDLAARLAGALRLGWPLCVWLQNSPEALEASAPTFADSDFPVLGGPGITTLDVFMPWGRRC